MDRKYFISRDVKEFKQTIIIWLIFSAYWNIFANTTVPWQYQNCVSPQNQQDLLRLNHFSVRNKFEEKISSLKFTLFSISSYAFWEARETIKAWSYHTKKYAKFDIAFRLKHSVMDFQKGLSWTGSVSPIPEEKRVLHNFYNFHGIMHIELVERKDSPDDGLISEFSQHAKTVALLLHLNETKLSASEVAILDFLNSKRFNSFTRSW